MKFLTEEVKLLSDQWHTLKKLKTTDTVDCVEILKLRGININPTDFFCPDFQYPPDQLTNLPEAVALLHDHIEHHSNILVVLDTDTDGITSGTIVYRYLKNFTDNVTYTIGHGKAHGLTQHGFNFLSQFDLVIACDSLSNEHDLYRELNAQGTEIILLDHHGCQAYENEYPNLTLTVNSENFDYPNKYLSGAGVAYKFCHAYDLCSGTKYAENYLDLAATGLIADVSDMTSMENRTICRLGMNNLQNKGLQTILKGYAFNATSIMFSIAPLINAANRLNQNETIARLLLSDDDKEIKTAYKQALLAKEQQDEIYKSELHNFHIQNSDGSLERGKFTYYITDHGAMTGYIAQKLCEETKKPSIVLTKNDDCYSGSIRSKNLADFRDWCTIGELAQAQGHPEAAGIKVYDLDNFLKELELELKDVALTKEQAYDLEIPLELIDLDLAEQTIKFNALTGNNFPTLNFVIRNLKPAAITIMKDKHTKFILGDITFLMWNNTDLADIYNSAYDAIDVAGTLDISTFRGQTTASFIIQDYQIKLYDIFI